MDYRPLTVWLMERITEGGEGQDPVVIDETTCAEFEHKLRLVPAGLDRQEQLVELTVLAGYLNQQYGARNTANRLLQMLEAPAAEEVVVFAEQEIEKTGQRVEEVGRRFDTFQGSHGEKLQDTGERLDPRAFKRPIRA